MPLALEEEENVVEAPIVDTPQEVVTEDDKEEGLAISDSDLLSDNTPVEAEVEVPKEEEPQPEKDKADEVSSVEDTEPVEEDTSISADNADESQIDEESDMLMPADTKAVEEEAEPVKEVAVVEDTPEQQEDKVEDTPVADDKTESATAAELSSDVKGPKVLDKIDLDNTNWTTRPKPKTKAERKEEQKQKKKERAEAHKELIAIKKAEAEEAKREAKEKAAKKKKAEKPKEPEVEMIETKVEKLTGPKVLGTIKLEEPKKKSDSKRSKRKRIRKPVNPNVVGAKSGKGSDQHAARGKGKKKGKQPVKQEPTDEEIRKQIKETLARLSPAGKSKASKHRRSKRDAIHKEAEAEQQKVLEQQKVIKATEFVTANDLANMMEVPVTKVIATCMEIGLFVSINQRMDAEAINVVAEEFGYKVEFVGAEVSQTVEVEEEDFGEEDMEPRAPIVTVMGHVDHGKTKLLDYVRKANVVAGEAGGITQHIGAYEVKRKDGKKVTFLDTPGHEAFTAMRARGAKVTDIAIIVIAADDKVMPQTVEAINHAQAANIPIVFAINKVDKPTANPDNIKNELSQMNILVEDWGGKYQSQEISALKGDGIDELLEKVLLEAELLDLKATPARKAQGSVIEASLDKGRGYVTKILVQDGTLRVGDMVLAGSTYGKVKAMFNERNQAVKEAGPSTPVLMLGLNMAPQAGDNFNVMTDEREVKAIASKREQLKRELSIRTQKHVTLDEIGRRLAIGDFKEWY